jgi:cysteinyl-tRNA synthetase
MKLLKPSELFPNQAATMLYWFDRAMYALGLNLQKAAPLSAEIPAAITALAEKRWAAKQAKDWAAADTLRKELTAAGWNMLDGKDGYKLEPVKK